MARKIERIVHPFPKPYSWIRPDFWDRCSGMGKGGQDFAFVAVGGTFDIFHKGHEQLISHAFAAGGRVLIGVTSDRLVHRLGKTHPFQPYAVRVRALRRFLKSKGWAHRARVLQLRDPFGPAARLKNLDALIITPNTFSNAMRLNRLRRERGLRTLKIVSVALAKARDGKPISSTRIRDGEIDRDGRLRRDPWQGSIS